MDKGFVTFGTEDFFPLAEILVRGLHEVSNRGVEFFCIGGQPGWSFPNLSVRRVDLPASTTHHVWNAKLYAASMTSFDVALVLDADMIPNLHIDQLLDLVGANPEEYPLAARHPADPCNQSDLMAMLGVEAKSMPYVHATYGLTGAAKPFLEECYSLALHLVDRGVCPPNGDETILNLMLWKCEASKSLNAYDPYFRFIDEYFEHRINELDLAYECEFSFHVFHGNKEMKSARADLDRLLSQESTGFWADAEKARPARVLDYSDV